jgi:ubiquitin-protein ligase
MFSDKRLMKDMKDLICAAKTSDTFSIDDCTSLNPFTIFINGPKGSLYEGLKFRVAISVSNNYPYMAPTVKFLSNIFHPNILNGNICLDTLGKTWGLTSTFLKIIADISSLLKNPNFDDKLNIDVTTKYKNNLKEFKKEILKQYKL